jgi:transposase-like protein
MRKIQHISGKVQVQIVQDYKEKLPNGLHRYTLKEIARKYEVSLSTVNNLARTARCQGRPHGGREQTVPTPRILKILRDSTEPGISLDEVGRRNPRCLVRRGKSVAVPLTKQRVSEIIRTWSRKLDMTKIHGRGFKPGDQIEWADQIYTVLRYDSSRQGAVREGTTDQGQVIDPFLWVHGGCRSKRLDYEGS